MIDGLELDGFNHENAIDRLQIEIIEANALQ